MQLPFFPVSLNLIGRRCVVIGPGDDREAIEKSAALRDSDVADAFFVISTPQDAELSARLRALADRHKFLLCCIDQPVYGFVAMTAIAKAGPVRVAISTAGLAPRVGKKLKERLQEAMDATFARFVERLGEMKLQMKAEKPGHKHSEARRAAMIEAAEGFDAHITFEYPDWYDATRG